MNIVATSSASKAVVGSFCLVALPYLLFAVTLPIGIDSGVYMYSGLVITDGGMPYLDYWDHKGPLLYLFNAAGLWLFGGAAGIILIEGILLFSSLVVSMILWQRYLSPVWSLVAAALFAHYFYKMFQGGNSTESWYVPFSLISYSLAFVSFVSRDAIEKTRYAYLFSTVAGVSLAVAALTRPNNGLGLAFLMLCFLMTQGTHFAKHLARMALSAALIIVPSIFYLSQGGAIEKFVDQYLIFNFAYMKQVGLLDRAAAFYLLCKEVIFSGLGLAVIGCLWFRFICNFTDSEDPKADRFAWIMIGVFVVEMVSQSFSGRAALHYVSITSSSLCVLLLALLRTVDPAGNGVGLIKSNIKWGLALVPVLILVSASPAKAIYLSFKNGTHTAGSRDYQLSTYLQEHSATDDKILVHGWSTWLLASSNRRSPTSITYYTPAIEHFKDSYEKYVSDTVSSRPLYIIEDPDSCGLSIECRSDAGAFLELRRLLESDYKKEATIHRYIFWRLKE